MKELGEDRCRREERKAKLAERERAPLVPPIAPIEEGEKRARVC